VPISCSLLNFELLCGARKYKLSGGGHRNPVAAKSRNGFNNRTNYRGFSTPAQITDANCHKDGGFSMGEPCPSAICRLLP
jgi:hypothetical protein